MHRLGIVVISGKKIPTVGVDEISFLNSWLISEIGRQFWRKKCELSFVYVRKFSPFT